MAALATLTLGAGPADAAKVLNVTAHGVDTGACGAFAQPCRTIEHALTRAASGNRVAVGPGVYPSVLLTKPLSMESTHGAAATIIQGDPNGIRVNTGPEGAVIGKPGLLMTSTRGVVSELHCRELQRRPQLLGQSGRPGGRPRRSGRLRRRHHHAVPAGARVRPQHGRPLEVPPGEGDAGARVRGGLSRRRA